MAPTITTPAMTQAGMWPNDSATFLFFDVDRVLKKVRVPDGTPESLTDRGDPVTLFQGRVDPWEIARSDR